MARLFQFSVRGLLWAVTFLAVGIAALLNANGLWQGAMWGLALYALTAAVLLVLYRREEKRAFWLGFAVFGFAYLLLLIVSQQSWLRITPLRQRELFATQLAQLAHDNLLPQSRRDQQVAVTYPPAQPPGGEAGAAMAEFMNATMAGAPPGAGMMPGADGPMPGMVGGGPGMMAGSRSAPMSGTFTMMVANPNYVPIENFTHIFHALCLLLIAAIGGKTCQLIYRTRPAQE